MVIEVNKDIDRYQESVAMGLTARQLDIFHCKRSGRWRYRPSSLQVYWSYGFCYLAIPCVAPIALGGFYSFNGMNFYEYMGKNCFYVWKQDTYLCINRGRACNKAVRSRTE